MDPDEIQFIGEKQTVTVIPNFNSPTIHFISGDAGPFRGGLPVNVPLWFAVSLKQQQKCVIVPPDWMSNEKLEDILNEEKISRTFVKMPSEHYMIEAKLILSCAADNVDKPDEIKTLLKDIWDLRISKIRKSIEILISESGLHAALDNLTLMEINVVKPLLPHSLDHMYRISQAFQGNKQHSGTTNSSLNFSHSM